MEHIEISGAQEESRMSDESLISEVKRLVGDECRSMATFLAHLAEVDDRRLYAKLGSSSLFAFLTKELHLSEDAAYKRIQVARAAKRFPIIISMIADGRLNLSSVNILCPILTEENHAELLGKAVHKSNREVEALRARYSPKPDVPDMIRMLPRETTCGAASSCLINDQKDENQDSEAKIQAAVDWALKVTTPARRERSEPISESRVKFQFTGSEELRKKFDRAREILRHKHPQGKIEDIVDEALEAFLDKNDPDRKLAREEKRHSRREPRKDESRSRHIPQHVRDVVWRRDEGRCQYVSPDGKRCEERGMLEIHHVHSWATGGRSNDPQNLILMCRTHNQYFAREEFGDLAVLSCPQ